MQWQHYAFLLWMTWIGLPWWDWMWFWWLLLVAYETCVIIHLIVSLPIGQGSACYYGSSICKLSLVGLNRTCMIQIIGTWYMHDLKSGISNIPIIGICPQSLVYPTMRFVWVGTLTLTKWWLKDTASGTCLLKTISSIKRMELILLAYVVVWKVSAPIEIS